ncbi:MAG: hypothetical protein WDM81_06420 [Rhizomicrobium sp.]
MLLKTLHHVVTIPSPAVQRGPDGLFAYVVKRDSTVETRLLKLNRFNSAQAVIDAGLKPGERVVSSGQYRLQDGALVQAARADAAAPSRRQPRGPCLEPFLPFHRPADRDVAFHDCDPPRGHRGLPVPAGRAAAAGRTFRRSRSRRSFPAPVPRPWHRR